MNNLERILYSMATSFLFGIIKGHYVDGHSKMVADVDSKIVVTCSKLFDNMWHIVLDNEHILLPNLDISECANACDKNGFSTPEEAYHCYVRWIGSICDLLWSKSDV